MRIIARPLVAIVLVAIVLEAGACATYALAALYGHDPHDPLYGVLSPVVPASLTRWSCGPLKRRFPNDPGNCYRAP